MKFLILSLICSLAASESSLYGVELSEHWETFKKTYSKSYDPIDEINRRWIFKENLAFIMNHNLEADLGLHNYTLGVNQFTDLTHDEFQAGLKCRAIPRSERNMTIFVADPNIEVAKQVDWTTKGYVTSVKDQRTCGSCYAFSAVGAIEGQVRRKTGKLTDLSAQQIVDCSTLKDAGCNGGWYRYSWDYIKNNRGLNRDRTYPYKNAQGPCLFNNRDISAKVTGYVLVKRKCEKSLKVACARVGPISVGMDASQKSFQHYNGGYYDDKNCRNDDAAMNHCVLLVGYGSTGSGKSKRKFWKIKNSWGPSFGERGYVRIPRNEKNRCGLATDAGYPQV